MRYSGFDHKRLGLRADLAMSCPAATHFDSPRRTGGRKASGGCSSTEPIPTYVTSTAAPPLTSLSLATGTTTTQAMTRPTRSSDHSQPKDH
jgi:hypothetical protein